MLFALFDVGRASYAEVGVYPVGGGSVVAIQSVLVLGVGVEELWSALRAVDFANDGGKLCWVRVGPGLYRTVYFEALSVGSG